MTESPPIDPAVVDRLRGLNAADGSDLVRDVMTLFLNDAPGRVSAIANAIASGNAPALERAAHTLTGASANIGAETLRLRCRDLEAIGKRGTVAGAAAALDQLHAEFERVRIEIQRLLGDSVEG